MIMGNIGALDDLKNDNRNYYLTGSRFFGTTRPGSDYDFFVQHDDVIEGELESREWVREWSGSYVDPIAVSCWHKDGVHVQIVSNVELKIEVQNFLLNTNLLTNLARGNKIMKRFVWTVALCMMHDMRGGD